LQVRLPKGVEPIQPTHCALSGAEEYYTALTDSEEDGERWTYVRPLPNHAIINLGDALVKFSAAILRSNIHRVVSPPGLQAETTRYSLVYFSRPEDDVLLRPLWGESEMIRRRAGAGEGAEEEELVMTSKEWILRRALGRRGVGRFEDSGGTEGVRA